MKKHLVTLTLLLGLSGVSFAQDDALELSLDEARQYAVSHNRSLQSASMDVQIAEAKRWQTISTMLPQASVSYDYQNMCGYTMDLGAMSLAMPPNATFGIQTSLAFTGAQIVGMQLQKIAIEMSNISLQKSERSIKSTVTKLYLSILVMESTVDLLDQNLENLTNLHKMTENSVKIGVVEQTDADKLLVQVATMRSSINATKRSLEMLYNSLILQLGASVNTKLVLTDKIESILNVDAAMEILNTQFALENNFDYQLLQKNLELSKKQITSAAMNFSPTVSLFHQYSSKKYFSDETTMDMTPPNVVGAKVSLPLWTSWQRMSKIKEAKLSYKSTENTVAQSRDGLLVQDKQLRYNLTSAYENYETQTSNLDVNKRVFNNITIKYEQGTASSLEVTNASSNLISAQSTYISAMLDLINAKTELEDLLNK